MCLLDRLALLVVLLAVAPANAADAPQFGKPVTPADIAAWDISIGPDGAGLPPGHCAKFAHSENGLPPAR